MTIDLFSDPALLLEIDASSRADSNARMLDAIREAAFASLRAPLQSVPAPIDPTDATEEHEASGRRKISLYDSRKTTARPARSSQLSGDP